jgi:hypothetical protein
MHVDADGHVDGQAHGQAHGQEVFLRLPYVAAAAPTWKCMCVLIGYSLQDVVVVAKETFLSHSRLP